MIKRALAARFFPLLVAVGLTSAPLTVWGEAVLEHTVGTEATPGGPPAPQQGGAGSGAEGAEAPDGDGDAEAEAKAEESQKPGPPPKRLKTISSHEAAGILGKQVIGAAGESVGLVVDVLIDSEGRPRAAVIDFGGFLGVGSRKIAVDWTLLQFRPGDHYAPILLDFTSETIHAAPEYRPTFTGPGVVVAPPEPPALPTGEPPPLPAGGPSAEDDTPAVAPDAAEPPAAPADLERPGASPSNDALPDLEMKPPDRANRSTVPMTDPDPDEDVPDAAPALPSPPPDARQ